jgi:hypothetical protein
MQMMQKNNLQLQQRQAHRVQWNVVVEAELEPNGEREVEQIAKAYKKTNKECCTWAFDVNGVIGVKESSLGDSSILVLLEIPGIRNELWLRKVWAP